MIRTARRHCKASFACGIALAAAMLLIAGSLPARAQGLRFGFEPAARFAASKAALVMTMRGEVEVGDAERLRRFIVGNRNHFIEHGGRVTFAIDGGDVLEAVRIGELLRDALVEIWLPDAASSRCVSACFFMFVHAPSRTAVADAVGIHRPYFDRTALVKSTPEAARERYESLALELRARMEQLSVPIALVERMFALPAGEVHRLTAEELSALGRTQAWFDDYLAARCARQSEREPGSPGSSYSQCVDEWLQGHRKDLVDRLARNSG